jgi:hypothetical protein
MPPQQQRPATQATPPAPVDPNAPIEERLNAQWGAVVNAFKRIPKRRFGIDALFRSSTKRTVVGSELVMLFSHSSNAERLQGELEEPRIRMEVERILAQALGEKVTVRVEIDNGRQHMSRGRVGNGGHLVRAAMSLGGQVVEQGNAPTRPSQPTSYSAPTERPSSSASGSPTSEGSPDPSAMNGHGATHADDPFATPTAEKEPRKQDVDEKEEALEDPSEETLDHQTPPAGRDEPQSEARPGAELSYEPIAEKTASEPTSKEGPEASAEQVAETPANDSEPPAMARNLFNEMQAVPRFTDEDDDEADGRPPFAGRSTQRARPQQTPSQPQRPAPRQQRTPQPAHRETIPEDYFPMPDEDFDS